MMRNGRKGLLCLLGLLVATLSYAQQEGENQLDVDLQMLGHGEMRLGGLDEKTLDSEGNPIEGNDRAYFLMGRSRLSIDYKRSGLETKITAQHSGVWGQKGQGSFNIFEAWAKLSMKNGLFGQIGRQALSYDDERIIGPNDWAMAALSHDVLRVGYEGRQHKVHLIVAYNQNAENIQGGTFYRDGAQPYKTMHTLWYHYDAPKIPLGTSLLFMNIGMQGGEKNGIYDNVARTRYQQLIGTYVSFKPSRGSIEASYYHQLGRNEENLKIDAWMASVRGRLNITERVGAVMGYDYLSGDPYFAVPGKGQIGTTRHKVIKGFNALYGSHHKFYGMMDFFYVRTYLNGFTPGLQNLYVGGTYSPVKGLNLKATYHYMATATKLEGIDMTLGHDLDLEARCQIMKDVSLSVGFSYMQGKETMERLRRADHDNSLKWGWFSLIVSPKLFSTRW